jgi:cell division protein FtsB
MKTIAENHINQFFLKECESHSLLKTKREAVTVAAIIVAVPLIIGAIKLYMDNEAQNRQIHQLNNKLDALAEEFSLMNRTFEVFFI